MEDRTTNQLGDLVERIRTLTSSPKSNKTLWSDGTLTWKDFEGSPPENRGGKTAVLHSYMEPKWEIQIADNNLHEFRFTSISACAISHKDSSWVIELGKCLEGLRHEQGHFDITEMYTRLFNKLAPNLMTQTYSHDENEPNLEAELNIIKLWDYVNQKRIEHQWKYEIDTKNGIDPILQLSHEKDIQKGLESMS